MFGKALLPTIFLFVFSFAKGQYVVDNIDSIKVDTITGFNNVIILVSGSTLLTFCVSTELCIAQCNFKSKIEKVFKGKLRMLFKDSLEYTFDFYFCDDYYKKLITYLDPKKYYILVLKRPWNRFFFYRFYTTILRRSILEY